MKTKTSLIKLNAKELAGILKISEFTVVKLARHGEIPCEFINKRPFFDLKRILAHFKKLERGAA